MAVDLRLTTNFRTIFLATRRPNLVQTVTQGRPEMLTNSCSLAVGICRSALRLLYRLATPTSNRICATIVLNSSKHSGPFSDHEDSQGITTDRGVVFYNITRVHKDSTWFVESQRIVARTAKRSFWNKFRPEIFCSVLSCSHHVGITWTLYKNCILLSCNLNRTDRKRRLILQSMFNWREVRWYWYLAVRRWRNYMYRGTNLIET